MDQTAEMDVRLFGAQLPSMQQLQALSRFVNSSETTRLRFAEEVRSQAESASAGAALAVGIGLFMLRHYDQAVEKLQKAQDCREKFSYLAAAYCKRRRYQEAMDCLRRTLDFGAEPLAVRLEKTALLRQAGDLQGARNELQGCANFENVSAEYHYQRARLRESLGEYDKAVTDYQTALELAPEHHQALFHLAYRCDLSGHESHAIEYYKQIVQGSPAYVSALLNLAVLYEDRGEFEKAARCIDKVLECHPNHARAALFKKDVDSSKTMYYDEEREKKRSRKNQILETPISDFELSVRSRNCLRKMNIRTLGDLLNITEAELLSYKNFGETSLREIKTILDSKGLRLGMALEDKQLQSGEALDLGTPEDQGLLNKTVDDLQLSVRARKCLQKLNLHTVGELTRTTEAELLGCKNFGVTSLNEIKKALGGLGLSLRNLD
ncbi:MAG: tetratricopeptide repeat protein [Sedimentisphaerales bacterium]|nr:tetratricopeptide repeat protein [Sedimentisphaerales bacterium]